MEFGKSIRAWSEQRVRNERKVDKPVCKRSGMVYRKAENRMQDYDCSCQSWHT